MRILILLILSLAIGPLAFAEAAPATNSATTRPITQAADGSVLLHARDATIHGTTVRYEPKPEKNTIGFWTKKEDWVSWEFDVIRPGKFNVIAMQGCGKGSGGADVEFAVAEQKLKMTVEETGGFQMFVERDVGVIELQPGRYTLSVKPLTKPGHAVMDLRQVVLKPK